MSADEFIALLDCVLTYHVEHHRSTTIQMRQALHGLQTGERHELHSKDSIADYLAQGSNLFRGAPFMGAVYAEAMRRHNELMISWRER